MGRLFAGTKWDRPPSCERCGRPEAECACPPPERTASSVPPEKQTAQVRVEKRAKGKRVTVVRGLDQDAHQLEELAAHLKAKCGSGGTVKEGAIEVQGEHLEAVEAALTALCYKTKRR